VGVFVHVVAAPATMSGGVGIICAEIAAFFGGIGVTAYGGTAVSWRGAGWGTGFGVSVGGFGGFLPL